MASYAYFLVLFCLVAASQARPSTPFQETGIFNEPHVFLTLKSIARSEDGDGILDDTQFELNWYGWEWEEGDNVALYNYNASDGIVGLPLASSPVTPTSAAQGTYQTTYRFGRPNVTSEDAGENCLGFWIAYVRRNVALKVNCFRKYPKWMNNLRPTIGDVPLSLLMIPGTHDAGAIREYDGVIADGPIIGYAVCQEEQLYRQFIMGIRYVDIRVAYYPATPEKFWINHGDARFQPLHTLFTAVRRFIEETGEIIFMDFHGFPVGFTDASIHSMLLDFVLESVGDLLLHETHVPSNPTPNDVWAANRTLILTYQVDSVSSQHPFLWPYLIHAWGNKNVVDPLEQYFETEAIPRYGCSGVWWSAMAEMTPTTQDAILYPFRGLRWFAQMVNIPLSYWWMRPHWYSRSMIISTDFFLGNNIIEMAVKANKEGAVCPTYR